MSLSLSVNGYSSRNNKEFAKHYEAVKFCIENELSFPKETSEFFKGRVAGYDLESFEESGILEFLNYGLSIDLPLKYDNDYNIRLKVSDIPKEVEEIVVELS